MEEDLNIIYAAYVFEKKVTVCKAYYNICRKWLKSFCFASFYQWLVLYKGSNNITSFLVLSGSIYHNNNKLELSNSNEALSDQL